MPHIATGTVPAFETCFIQFITVRVTARVFRSYNDCRHYLQLKNTSSNTRLYKRRNHFASSGLFVHLSNAKSFLFSTPRGITTPSLKPPRLGGGCMIEKNAGVVGPRPYFSIPFSFLFLMIALTNTLFLMFFLYKSLIYYFFSLPPSLSLHQIIHHFL